MGGTGEWDKGGDNSVEPFLRTYTEGHGGYTEGHRE
jgi:hypothetical protein